MLIERKKREQKEAELKAALRAKRAAENPFLFGRHLTQKLVGGGGGSGRSREDSIITMDEYKGMQRVHSAAMTEVETKRKRVRAA